MMLGGASFSIALPFDACQVPSGINGPVAIYITSDMQPLANDVVQQATQTIVAGPTMAFIDTIIEDLGSLARDGTCNPVGSSSSSSDGSCNPSSDGSCNPVTSSSDGSCNPGSDGSCNPVSTVPIVMSSIDASAMASLYGTATAAPAIVTASSASVDTSALITASASASVSAVPGTVTSVTTLSPQDYSSISASLAAASFTAVPVASSVSVAVSQVTAIGSLGAQSS